VRIKLKKWTKNKIKELKFKKLELDRGEEKL